MWRREALCRSIGRDRTDPAGTQAGEERSASTVQEAEPNPGGCLHSFRVIGGGVVMAEPAGSVEVTISRAALMK